MKKVFAIIIFLLYSRSFAAEIVDNITIEDKKFGDWTISCSEDVMMDNIECKIYSTFYNDSSSIYVQPNNKIANQVVIMIPSISEDTIVKVKVDKNDIINSDIISRKPEYGVIPFPPAKQKLMLSQFKNGQEIYIRFTVRDLKAASGRKEITAKISLSEFSKMLIYYDSKVGNRIP